MNEINDGIHVLQFHIRMGHEEPQDRAPEVGVLNSLSEGADGDFAGKLLTASESSRLTIAQGLHRCVVVRCLTNVMFHAARENQGQVQRPNGRSATEPNKPGLLTKCLWPGSEIPRRIHKARHRIVGKEMTGQ